MEKIKNELKRIENVFSRSLLIEGYINSNDNLLKEKKTMNYFIMFLVTLIFSLVYLINQNTEMLILFAVLCVGSLLTSVLISSTSINTENFDWLWTIVSCVGFTSGVLNGIDDGFVIFWLLLLPYAIMALNKNNGVYTTIYILVFVLVICFTPLKNNISDYYSDYFLNKFAFMAFCSCLLAVCLWLRVSLSEKDLLIRTYTDELTGLGNNVFFNEVCDYIERNGQKSEYIFVSFDVNGLKNINEAKGQLVGDKILKAVANVISSASDKYICTCRVGADEFVAIIKGNKMSIDSYESKLEALRTQQKIEGYDNVSFSYGIIACIDHLDKTIREIHKMANEKMSKEKVNYCIHNGINRRVKQRRGADRRKTNLIGSTK